MTLSTLLQPCWVEGAGPKDNAGAASTSTRNALAIFRILNASITPFFLRKIVTEKHTTSFEFLGLVLAHADRFWGVLPSAMPSASPRSAGGAAVAMGAGKTVARKRPGDNGGAGNSRAQDMAPGGLNLRSSTVGPRPFGAVDRAAPKSLESGKTKKKKEKEELEAHLEPLRQQHNGSREQRSVHDQMQQHKTGTGDHTPFWGGWSPGVVSTDCTDRCQCSCGMIHQCS